VILPLKGSSSFCFLLNPLEEECKEEVPEEPLQYSFTQMSPQALLLDGKRSGAGLGGSCWFFSFSFPIFLTTVFLSDRCSFWSLRRL
jgi:hypothetical protein